MESKVTCCGALETLEERNGSPVYRPIQVNPKTLSLTAGDWALQLTPLTPSGRVAKRGQGAVFINFCPFCGKRIKED